MSNRWSSEVRSQITNRLIILLRQDNQLWNWPKTSPNLLSTAICYIKPTQQQLVNRILVIMKISFGSLSLWILMATTTNTLNAETTVRRIAYVSSLVCEYVNFIWAINSSASSRHLVMRIFQRLVWRWILRNGQRPSPPNVMTILLARFRWVSRFRRLETIHFCLHQQQWIFAFSSNIHRLISGTLPGQRKHS